MLYQFYRLVLSLVVITIFLITSFVEWLTRGNSAIGGILIFNCIGAWWVFLLQVLAKFITSQQDEGIFNWILESRHPKALTMFYLLNLVGFIGAIFGFVFFTVAFFHLAMNWSLLISMIGTSIIILPVIVITMRLLLNLRKSRL